MEKRKEEASNKNLDQKKLMEDLGLAQKERDEYLNGWKRAKADLINFKKETEKTISELGDFSRMGTVLAFLPLVDSLEEAAKSDIEGLSQVYLQAKEALKNQGVEEIKTKAGDNFNPELHEAIGGEGDKIEEVVQKGYLYKKRTIRPTKVKVSK